jgi:hypothetical protein
MSSRHDMENFVEYLTYQFDNQQTWIGSAEDESRPISYSLSGSYVLTTGLLLIYGLQSTRRGMTFCTGVLTRA